jgi:type III secretion system FlhB-like substrate exporter
MAVYAHTRVDLVERALRALGQIAEGQNASAEDVDIVDREVDPVLALLEAREILAINDDDEIPSEVFLALANILAFHVAPTFNVVGEDLLNVTALAQRGEADLKEITRSRPTYRPQTVEYF